MELDDIIISIGRILNNLEKIQEEKGVPNRNSSLIDKNITNSSLGKKKETGSISSNEKKKLIEVFNLFNDSFFKYQQKQKPDDKQSTLISNIQKEQRPASEKKEKSSSKGGVLSSLADLLLPLIGGVALIGASIPIIIGSLFEKVGLAKDAMKVLGKVGLIGGLKILAKTFLKKFSLVALKRIPYLGGLIGLAFAYQEFKAGRIIPGMLELVSGLSNFVPIVGPVLSIGVDILKGFLEAKGSFKEGGSLSNANAWTTIKEWFAKAGDWISENAMNLPILGTFKRLAMSWDAFQSGNWGEGFKQFGIGMLSLLGGSDWVEKGVNWMLAFFSGESKGEEATLPQGGIMGTVKGWVGSIGKFIKDNSLYMPIIGGIQRFGMSWDSFKNGDWSEGFKQLGLGMFTFVGGGPLIKGFEMMQDWFFGNQQEDEKSLSPDGSWKNRLKNWIKGKLNKLPAFLRKPLEWFGILDETGTEAGDNSKVETPKSGNTKDLTNPVEDEKKGFFSRMADSIGNGLSKIGDFAGNMFSSIKDIIKKSFNGLVDKFSQIIPEITKVTQELKDKLSSTVQEIFKTVTNIVTPVITGIFDKLSSTVQEIFKTVTPIVTPVIASIFDKLSSTVQEIFKTVIPVVTPVITGIFDKLSSTVQEIFKTMGPVVTPVIVSIFDKLSSTVQEIFKTVIPAITPAITTIFDKLSSTVQEIFKTVTPIVTPIITSIFDNLSSVLKEIFKTVTPIVTPMIVGAFDNLSSIIKNSDILSKDKYEILKSSKEASNFENTQNDVKNIQNINVKNDDILSIGNIIENASSNQCKYLESLITLGNLSLKELKRMNGSSSSGGMVVAPPIINDSDRSMINMTDNRSGYAGSVYALA